MGQDANPEFLVPPERVPGKCYADGCGKDIPTNMLMCVEHWRRVPRYIQTHVWGSNYLAHPRYSSSRLAARISVALKEGLPWGTLPPGYREVALDYGLARDGNMQKGAKR